MILLSLFCSTIIRVIHLSMGKITHSHSLSNFGMKPHTTCEAGRTDSRLFVFRMNRDFLDSCVGNLVGVDRSKFGMVRHKDTEDLFAEALEEMLLNPEERPANRGGPQFGKHRRHLCLHRF